MSYVPVVGQPAKLNLQGFNVERLFNNRTRYRERDFLTGADDNCVGN